MAYIPRRARVAARRTMVIPTQNRLQRPVQMQYRGGVRSPVTFSGIAGRAGIPGQSTTGAFQGAPQGAVSLPAGGGGITGVNRAPYAGYGTRPRMRTTLRKVIDPESLPENYVPVDTSPRAAFQRYRQGRVLDRAGRQV